jgi:hypothetical protein
MTPSSFPRSGASKEPRAIQNRGSFNGVIDGLIAKSRLRALAGGIT